MGKPFLRICACAALAAPLAARSDLQVVDSMFMVLPPDSPNATPVDSASMDDGHICIVIRGTELPDGDHEFRVTMQDGKGHDAHHYETNLRPAYGRWRVWSCYSYRRDLDAPGDWTFTVEVDGRQVLEKDLYVAAAKR